MALKRNTLPKNFKDLIAAGDMEALKAVFDTCDINAYYGRNKEPALSFSRIPEELVRWLVGQGADINRADITYQRTPLHHRAMTRTGDITVFLELGADVHALDQYGTTPLHFAAGSFNAKAVQALLDYGANPLVQNKRGHMPLEYGLGSASNIDIKYLVEIASILLEAGTPTTPFMAECVNHIGKNFEFHRENFARDSVDAVSAALDKLYEIFGVQPVERRVMHDGISPIHVPAGKPPERHNALWELLVPSQGPAKTVQGEVVRITGRVHDEIYRNGGANWDADYRKMLNALLRHLASGRQLEAELLKEAAALAKQPRPNEEEALRLCELAVRWVDANPEPVTMMQPDYNR